MIIQLDPPLRMITPRGKGQCHFLIDYGPEADLIWVTFLDSDGTCWCVPNKDIKIEENWTLGRRLCDSSS